MNNLELYVFIWKDIYNIISEKSKVNLKMIYIKNLIIFG